MKAELLVFLLCLPILFGSLPSANADYKTLTLYPIDDAYVDSDYPNGVFGDLAFLRLCAYTRHPEIWFIGAERFQYAYIKFDLSSIPTSAIISSGKLKLYATAATTSFEVSAYFSGDNSWSEYSISSTTILGWENPAKKTTVNRANTWYSWDVTNEVGRAKGGKLTEVLACSFASGMDYVTFHSKETPLTDYRPRLEVFYKMPEARKASSSITCAVSPLKIKQGENIQVSGSLSPPRSAATVTLTLERPDGSMSTNTVATGSEGVFSYTYAPDVEGIWKVVSSWDGDENHLGAASPPFSFIVEKTKPAQTPIDLVYFSILGFIILMTVALVILKRRK